MDGRMIWLTQRLMAELYQVTVVNINQHPKAIYAEGGFFPEATTKQFLIVQSVRKFPGTDPGRGKIVSDTGAVVTGYPPPVGAVTSGDTHQ
jgi:hypothetical protein